MNYLSLSLFDYSLYNQIRESNTRNRPTPIILQFHLVNIAQEE